MSESKPKYPRFQDPRVNNIAPKRKKNAPDRPQPAWLFPPDKENPILNPKPKSDDKMQKEAAERETSLDYMKRRVHAVPDRPAPPPQLLTLVGAFLTEYGFNSTSRLFTNERKARQTLNDWEDALGKKLERGVPSLETIYKDFYRNWQIAKADETSSSSSADEEDFEPVSNHIKPSRSSGESEASSEAGSVSSSDQSEANSKIIDSKNVQSPSTSPSSADDSEEETSVKVKAPSTKKGRKSTRSSSSLSSSSDSDADDEEELVKVRVDKERPDSHTTNKLKRKASLSSSDTSTSSESSEDERPPPKKSKTTTNPITALDSLPEANIANPAPKSTVDKSSSSSVSSSSESEASLSAPQMPAAKSVLKKQHQRSSVSSQTSDSDSDASSSSSDAGVGIQIAATNQPRERSDESTSSTTLSGDAKPLSNLGTPSMGAGTTPVAKGKVPTNESSSKSVKGAKPTPLAAAATAQDLAELRASHLSNAYVPYDYADRAYNDLSVTRGKNFTKEKNKKKRGSYRGGNIDIGSGKGYKFTD